LNDGQFVLKFARSLANRRQIPKHAVELRSYRNLVANRLSPLRRPALDAGLGFSFVTPHSEFCENSSLTYFLRGLRVKETMPGSREVREGKKSAKGLRYLIATKMEEAQPRVEHGATGV
jgi:hypothetical protein